MRTSNTIIALILLALAVAGAWRWYEAQSKNQKMETAAQDVRETAECHLEAFKLRPELTETDLEFRPRSWTFVWRREDTCFFQAAPPMPLVTSSIRFAGGRIEA